MIIQASAVVTPDKVFEPGWVEVNGTVICAVGFGVPPRPADHVLLETLAPGFIDAHVHGGGGFSFGDDDPVAADHIAEIHCLHGTTSIMASLVSSPLEELVSTVGRLSKKVEEGVLAGIHLEGPWLSVDHRGAHAPELLRAPQLTAVKEVLTAGVGAIRMVTLAPELDGSADAIREIVVQGAVAAIGHTGASYEQARGAIDAGARVGTHLFNGMRSIHHRDPGPVMALMENSSIFNEVIADGFHLHPAVIRAVFNSPCKTVLVTDAMAAAAAPDGRYMLGQVEVDVFDGQARAVSNGSIAGSTLTLDAALRFTVQEAGVPLVQAIKALTVHPATMLNLSEVGRIEISKRADLVALNEDLDVTAVMRAGRWITAPKPQP